MKKRKKKQSAKKTYQENSGLVMGVGVLFLVAVAGTFAIPSLFATNYSVDDQSAEAAGTEKVVDKGDKNDVADESEEDQKEVDKIDKTQSFTPTHIPTPESVRAIYMTSWVAGTKSLREPIISFIEESELNAIVIDIKDDTGRISFDVYDPYLDSVGSEHIRIPDLRELIERLHSKGIYVIGRVSVFQDPYFVKLHPDQAVKRASDGEVWTDRKGISWMDASSELVWNYVLEIGKEAYRAGFDEINYDYVRFPSDGNMQDIAYPYSEQKVLADPYNGKAEVMREFYKFIATELKAYQPYPDQPRPVVSADLFGMTTTNSDDLNIGQKLEYALPYFDYIAPMVYPSHYPDGFIGLTNPAAYPYEVIDYSMSRALIKIDNLVHSASTTPEIADNVYHDKIRPWLQDFNLGATYTASMVREQIQATYDNGLDSWMIWDASNTYTKGAFKPYWEDVEAQVDTNTSQEDTIGEQN